MTTMIAMFIILTIIGGLVEFERRNRNNGFSERNGSSAAGALHTGMAG